MTEPVPPFGTFAPTPWQMRLIQSARRFDPGALSKTAASIGKRLLFPGLTGPLDLLTWGIAMRLDPRRNVTEKRLVFSPSRFELEERQFLTEALRPGDQFVDVGANIGAYSLWAAQKVGPQGMVVSIEPQPAVLARLRANMALNPAFPSRIFGCGAGPDVTTMSLSVGGSNEGGASLDNKGGGQGTIDVAVRPLLDIITEAGLSRIDAMKVDIEGFEDQALMPFLMHAPATLWPRILILERSEKDWTQDLLGALSARDYQMHFQTKRNHVLVRNLTSDEAKRA